MVMHKIEKLQQLSRKVFGPSAAQLSTYFYWVGRAVRCPHSVEAASSKRLAHALLLPDGWQFPKSGTKQLGVGKTKQVSSNRLQRGSCFSNTESSHQQLMLSLSAKAFLPDARVVRLHCAARTLPPAAGCQLLPAASLISHQSTRYSLRRMVCG